MVPKRTGGSMRTLFAALLAAALSGLLASPLRAETLEEIYAKAKGEGALSIYGGGPARLYEGWVKEYEARFPRHQGAGDRRLCRRTCACDRQADRGRQARRRFRDLPGGAGIHPLETRERAAAVPDGRVRGARSAFPRCGWCLHA